MNKRIAIISPSFPPSSIGGIDSSNYNLYNALFNKGFEIKVFTYNDQKKELGKLLFRSGSSKLLIKLINLFCGIYFKIKDRNKIAYQFRDILHSVFGSIKINKEIIKYSPDFLILPDQGAPGLFIYKRGKCKFILISHHNPIRFLDNPVFGIHSETDANFAIKIENRVLKKIDKVVCPSNYMKDKFIKTYNFNKSIKVIPNIIAKDFLNSIEIVNIREQLALKENSIIIYIPSAFSKFKGSRYVFEIIRRISSNISENIGFYLPGSMDDDLLIYELNYAPNNAKIFCPGQLEYAKNISYVKSCSFVISPTLIENYSMALAEANFCDLPIITFDVGGNSDIITNDENGFLAPYLDIESLINLSLKLLDDNLRNKIIKKIKQTNQNYNQVNIAQEFINYIMH